MSTHVDNPRVDMVYDPARNLPLVDRRVQAPDWLAGDFCCGVSDVGFFGDVLRWFCVASAAQILGLQVHLADFHPLLARVRAECYVGVILCKNASTDHAPA